ncbi:MAG TPA: hypothetical protein VHV77_04340 [Pirellulales bacterium]|jgi:hypothetical protein|nr:hypothetical protein [Pirellulales bacterium]
MRVLLSLAWLAAGALFVAWHAGPGQDRVALDDAGHLATQALVEAEKGQWVQAVGYYDAALSRLPAGQEPLARKVRLERAKARMLAEQLPEARAELGTLVDELQADPGAPPELLSQARQALADAQYYVTWLLRLEGEPATVWEPEIESARQLHRMLAEDAQQEGRATEATEHREDVEATIRLERMDLSELQALKLPAQCCNCKGGACKGACRKQGRNPGRSMNDAKDARGASLGPPPDDSGN